MPFKNDNEGNLFRSWVNKEYPEYAKSIDLEEEGSCSNCFIQLAWEKYYQEYITSKDGKKLHFTPPNNILNKNNAKKEEVLNIEIDTEKDVFAEFNIIEEHYIIIGCFKNIKNANAYSKKITKKGHQTFIFFDKNANCNFVSIGPHTDKEIALSNLPSIKEKIDKNAWIFTKIK